MKITVFAKARQTKDGKPFTSYVSKLKQKDGGEMTVTVKFRQECGAPNRDECPMYINIEKQNANLNRSEVVNEETGEVYERRELWVSKWERDPEIYRDTSLDDFED